MGWCHAPKLLEATHFFSTTCLQKFFFYKTEILKTGSPSRNRRHKKHSTFISSSSRLLNHEIFPQKTATRVKTKLHCEIKQGEHVIKIDIQTSVEHITQGRIVERKPTLLTRLPTQVCCYPNRNLERIIRFFFNSNYHVLVTS